MNKLNMVNLGFSYNETTYNSKITLIGGMFIYADEYEGLIYEHNGVSLDYVQVIDQYVEK